MASASESEIGILEHLGHLERLLLTAQSVLELHFHLERGIRVVPARERVEKRGGGVAGEGAVAVGARVGEALVHRHLAAEDGRDDGADAGRGTAAAAASRERSEEVDQGGQDGDDVREAPRVGGPPPESDTYMQRVLHLSTAFMEASSIVLSTAFHSLTKSPVPWLARNQTAEQNPWLNLDEPRSIIVV